MIYFIVVLSLSIPFIISDTKKFLVLKNVKQEKGQLGRLGWNEVYENLLEELQKHED